MADNIALMLHIRLAEMLGFARHIDDPRRVAELHDMRIAAKRLRYSMELFLPYFEGSAAKTLSGLLDKTKKVQELIGEIRDRDVRIPMIAEFLHANEPRRPELRVGLLRLIEQESADRERIYRQLLDYWQDQQPRYVGRLMALIGSIGEGADLTVADDG